MGKVQRVILFGNTLILAGIEASISLDPNCEVIGHLLTASLEELCAIHPNVVIFDLDEMQPEFLQAKFQSELDLLQVGIDTESHTVLLTGQATRLIMLDQIIKILRTRDPPCGEKAVPLPGPGNLSG